MAVAQAPSLPDGVILEILVRLPACCIGRFRAVCKAWRAATTHPSFDRSLAERAPAVAKVAFEAAFIACSCCPGLSFNLFRGLWYRSSNARHNVASARTVAFPSRFGFVIIIHGSWDGVLCLQLRFYNEPTADDDYVLWNPVTDAGATVPAPIGTGRLIGGYAHPVTRRFHLLHSSDEAVPGRDDLLAPLAFRILRVGGGAGWRELPPLSPTFTAATAVEVVQGVEEGEEIVLCLEDRIERPGRCVAQGKRRQERVSADAQGQRPAT